MFFLSDISAAVDEQDPQTCNVALIIAAIRAIEHAKQHGKRQDSFATEIFTLTFIFRQ